MRFRDQRADPSWGVVRATVLAQHRTLRLLIESARAVAQALLSGDELGVVVMPYLIVGLDRALDYHLTLEESLVCPLLERDLPEGRALAESLRSAHDRIRLEMADLGRGGAQQAVTLAYRLQTLTGELLVSMLEEERTLWAEPATSRPSTMPA